MATNGCARNHVTTHITRVWCERDVWMAETSSQNLRCCCRMQHQCGLPSERVWIQAWSWTLRGASVEDLIRLAFAVDRFDEHHDPHQRAFTIFDPFWLDRPRHMPLRRSQGSDAGLGMSFFWAPWAHSCKDLVTCCNDSLAHFSEPTQSSARFFNFWNSQRQPLHVYWTLTSDVHVACKC